MEHQKRNIRMVTYFFNCRFEEYLLKEIEVLSDHNDQVYIPALNKTLYPGINLFIGYLMEAMFFIHKEIMKVILILLLKYRQYLIFFSHM